jgi:hypothetical protein
MYSWWRVMAAAAILSCALLPACGEEPRAARPEPASPSVVVEGLVLEAHDLSRPGSADLVVRADRAVFDDLPGRGAGLLEGATISMGEHVTLRAQVARVGPRGELHGEGVRATLRPPPREVGP